ncbi:YagK/YfjJ domain-containing protein [Acinetobacter faecalis]|uniref:YagK/YfjJ domain-containing protein n=1 Tax=Acinetobacter faecalis TaxID=2665161 RepID=UPI002A91E7E0|nr:inovirus-type Gp2 protein [Acinetobacter faecalis]MDY6456793.1 inovirus-type Gp2 protein [Acinetobacter faecalis]
MSDKINQAQLFLNIENFLKRLKRRRTEWNGFYEELTDLLLDFNEVYDPDYDYTGYVKFFIVLYFDLISIDSGFESLSDELDDIGFEEIRRWFFEYYQSFEADYEDIINQKKENRREIANYCRNVIDRCSRILVVRVDIGYLQEYQRRIKVDDLYFDLDKLVNKIQNKDGIFKHVIGYAWGLEQGGKSKGYHCHLAVIYDTAQRSPNARYWGDEIIKLWKEITSDYGQGYNCYNRERVTELRNQGRLGIGVIHRKYPDQVQNFIESMSYLTDPDKRTDQYLRVKPMGRRTFGKGQMREKRLRR